MTGGAPSPAIEKAAAGGLPQAEQQQQQQQQPPRRRYRGVRLRKWGSWVAEVRFPNSRERLWLGSYATEEQAARAFDAALFCLRGPGAEFNFPGQVPEIPIAAELSREEIRAAAARFAGQGAPPITLRDEGSGGDVTAMEAAPGSAGEGTMTAESSSSRTTSVGVFTGFEFYITATAEAPVWQNEEEEAAAAAAVYSFDDIYSTSPLWNFNN